MRSTLRERWSEWSHATERELAPHVEDEWAEDFVVELRLQGVEGPTIGEALTEVESHCAESGESAPHAFGDPIGYAQSLRLPRSEDDTTRAIAAAAAPTIVQLAAMFITPWAFEDLVAGTELTLTSGQILNVALLGALIALLVCFAEKALRFLVRHTVGAILLMVGIPALSTLVVLLGKDELVTLPAVPVLVVSVIALLGGATWQWTRTRRGVDEDPLTSPLAGARPLDGPPPEQVRRPSRWMALSYLAIPVCTVLLLAPSLAMAQR